MYLKYSTHLCEWCLLLVQGRQWAVLHLAVALLLSGHLPLLLISLCVLHDGSDSFFSGKSLFIYLYIYTYMYIYILFSRIHDLIFQTSKKKSYEAVNDFDWTRSAQRFGGGGVAFVSCLLGFSAFWLASEDGRVWVEAEWLCDGRSHFLFLS